MLSVIGLTLYGTDAMVSCVSPVDFGTSKHAGAATVAALIPLPH
ncbi:hypothetical protein QSJ19_16310 [Gordonia sp. ABSL11-1]|nr:hypothetical protein [Gordonia sp. ABSL11-1]MDL9947122.1 hypothetical protein [Gordonia sp. ABSL11-1]